MRNVNISMSKILNKGDTRSSLLERKLKCLNQWMMDYYQTDWPGRIRSIEYHSTKNLIEEGMVIKAMMEHNKDISNKRKNVDVKFISWLRKIESENVKKLKEELC